MGHSSAEDSGNRDPVGTTICRTPRANFIHVRGAPSPYRSAFLPTGFPMFKDALRQALADTTLEARELGTAPAPASRGPVLPHPRDHEWGKLLTGVPADASLGRWRQVSQARIKEWKAAGRKRDVKALDAAWKKFEKQYEKAAWRAIKDRWSALSYPEKMYRRLKGAKVDPAKIVERLHTRRAETMATAGGAALWTWVTTGKKPG